MLGHLARLAAVAIAGAAALALSIATLPVAANAGTAVPSGNAERSDRLDRANDAAETLMQMYDAETGLWPSTGWWNSANATTAILDHAQATGSPEYLDEVANTFQKNKQDDFTNEYMDDTGWWGLAWVRAYDVTGEQRYLAMAQKTADYMYSFRDDHCGGGIWWRDDKTYKNAVTNELFIKLAASLHNRIDGDTTNLERAQEIWAWFDASGMINEEGLVNDGLDNDTCKNNGDTTWTYNQGIILGGLVELHQATGNDELLARARSIADAATTSSDLNPSGILTEPCEASDDCGGDGPSFKGVFVRNLGELDRALDGSPYSAYLERQAASAYANARTDKNEYGLKWAGPFDTADGTRQHSAVDLMTAASYG